MEDVVADRQVMLQAEGREDYTVPHRKGKAQLFGIFLDRHLSRVWRLYSSWCDGRGGITRQWGVGIIHGGGLHILLSIAVLR